MKIRRYIECNYEPEICNLQCSYCYLTQQNRKKQEYKIENYSAEFVRKALSKRRLGGECFISLSVAGETMHSDYIVKVAWELLKEGHIVNITTNGTLCKQFEKLFSKSDVPYKHLLVSFSFHYSELLRLNLLDVFWENVNLVKKKGASFYIKLNLCDDNIAYLDDINTMCCEKIGDKPQLELTRKENYGYHTLMTKFTRRNYWNIGAKNDSELFKFTISNFGVNRKNNFCYAGAWSLVVNLRNGETRGCYCDERIQNIYEDVNKKIDFSPIGNNCKKYCHNGQHFLAWGVIPELSILSYLKMRQYQGNVTFTKEMQKCINCKLEESNRKLTKVEKNIFTYKYRWKIRKNEKCNDNSSTSRR